MSRDPDQLTKDLAMMVGILSYQLRKSDPKSKWPDKAIDFLRRNGLEGSPLRDDSHG